MAKFLVLIASALLWASSALAQQNGQTLTQLPPATLPLSGQELMYVVQNGNSKSAPASVFNPTFNIDAFNAKGDRTSDDGPALASAFAACAQAGGGRITIGPKGYYIGTLVTALPFSYGYIPGNCVLDSGVNILPLASNQPNAREVQPYSFILGPGVTLQLGSGSTPDKASGLRNVAVFSSSYTSPTSLQTAYSAIAAFAGTGILVPHTSQGSIIENVIAEGFNLGLDSETDDAKYENVYIDATNCFNTNNATNYNFSDKVQCIPLLTIGVTGADSQFSVSAVANDGTGQVQLTVANAATGGGINTSALANGNTAYVFNLGGRKDVYGKYTIANLAIGASTTTFSLVGSSYVAQTGFTGSVVSGSTWVTGLSSTTNLGYYAPGTTLTDASSCIPASDTVLWVNPDTTELQLTSPATCSQSGDALTSTPGSYTSGGVVDFNAVYRSGYGYKVTNSQGVVFSNTFDFGHQIEYDVSTGSFWASFLGFQCDGSGSGPDPTRICINIEDTARKALFTGASAILDAGVAVKVNTTDTLSADGSIINDSTIENNGFLGLEVLSGGLDVAAGVHFRSINPNFVGDAGTVQMLGRNDQSANPGNIYQSAADASNIGVAFEGAGLALGGQAVPTAGVYALAPDDATCGFRLDSTFVNYDSYVCLQTELLLMNRHSGSNGNFAIRTTNTSSWGASPKAGSIELQPNGSQAFFCMVGGKCGLGVTDTVAPGTQFDIGGPYRSTDVHHVAALGTCTSANKFAWSNVDDATGPTYNATLTGGGSAVIPVYCDGANWRAH